MNPNFTDPQHPSLFVYIPLQTNIVWLCPEVEQGLDEDSSLWSSAARMVRFSDGRLAFLDEGNHILCFGRAPIVPYDGQTYAARALVQVPRNPYFHLMYALQGIAQSVSTPLADREELPRDRDLRIWREQRARRR